jgi:dihydropteroate synthase
MGHDSPFISDRTLLMGIVNITPDSFSDGGRFATHDAAVTHAETLIADGADLLDIGGESTRPGATPVPVEEELHRVIPVIRLLARHARVPISIDTMKPAVARAALDEGATIVNDITGFQDAEMVRVTADHQAAAVTMHMRGTPQTMASLTQYDDVVEEVRQALSAQVVRLRDAGVEHIAIDPGIGFAKSAEQSLSLIRRLAELKSIGCPILLGVSRKSFLGKIAGETEPSKRLESTLAAAVVGVMNGASVVRVHDVAQCRRALAVADALKPAPGQMSA